MPLAEHTRWAAVTARNTRVLFRTKAVVFAGLVDGLVLLLAAGIGLGGLVGTVSSRGSEIEYLLFVGPALMVTAAVTGAIAEGGHGVFARSRYERVYRLMALTPMRAGDALAGETISGLIRALWYSSGVALVLVWFLHPTLLQAIAILAVLTVVACASAWIGVGCAARMTSWQQLSWFEMVVFPLTLFSGTLFPPDIVHPLLAALIYVSPVYHAAELTRGILGVHLLDLPLVMLHGSIVVACAFAAWLLARGGMRRLMTGQSR